MKIGVEHKDGIINTSESNGIWMRKSGDVVTIQIGGTVSWGSTTGGATELLSNSLPLPENYRPKNHVYFEVSDGGTSTNRYLGIVRYDNGKVAIWKRDATITNIYGTITYITKD